MNLLDKCTDIYGEHVDLPVFPSVKQWTAYEHSCKVVAEGFITNKRWEPEALGLLLQLCKPPIIASIWMLLETFECSDPLGLVLQKRDGSICLSDLPTYIEMMEHQLSKAKTTQK